MALFMAMNTFKPSGGFKRGGGGRSFNDRPKFGGGNKGGGNGGGRSFSDRPRRDSGGDRQTFQATCASCQKSCEVPFRPTGDKPVYCSDCFSKSRNDDRGSSRPARPTDRRSAAPAPRQDDAKVEQRLILIEGKLQRILELLQQPKDTDRREVVKPKTEVDTTGLKKAVAKAVKKPAAKKVVKKAVKKVVKKK